MATARSRFTQAAAKWLGTVGGIGEVPLLPGSLASLAGWGLGWWLRPYPVLLGAAAAATIVIGFAVTKPCQAIFHNDDPHQVVIDEVAGMLLAAVAIPPQFLWFVAAFALFRAIDILKPFPIDLVEDRTGWWGVVLDDVAAGVYTAIIVQILAHWK